MAQQLDVHVVTAPFVQIDQRALSQAWYSALQLARSSASLAKSPRGVAASTFTAGGFSPATEGKTVGEARGNGFAPRDAVKALPRTVCEADRARHAPSPRRVQRTKANARVPGLRSTLTLGRGAARVYLLLQNVGNVTRAIAICRAADRERVAAALADACAALATRGARLDTRVGVRPCS